LTTSSWNALVAKEGVKDFNDVSVEKEDACDAEAL
jgi:hypothetical protein|tara:strand:+ start:1463 stop:1567 length:105 start_codon:yes stop_codon:yes gene_type:complete